MDNHINVKSSHEMYQQGHLSVNNQGQSSTLYFVLRETIYTAHLLLLKHLRNSSYFT